MIAFSLWAFQNDEYNYMKQQKWIELKNPLVSI